MNKEKLIKELKFKAIRSSGAGGQHVNKVSSKVELSFNVESATSLSLKEKERIRLKLASKLTKDSVFILQCDEARSQHKNKKLVIERFFKMLKNALHIPKKRKATKPSKAAIEKRLNAKKNASTKKVNRQKPTLD